MHHSPDSNLAVNLVQRTDTHKERTNWTRIRSNEGMNVVQSGGKKKIKWPFVYPLGRSYAYPTRLDKLLELFRNIMS